MSTKRNTRVADATGHEALEIGAVKPRWHRWVTWAHVLLLSLVYVLLFQRIKDDRVFLDGDGADYYILARSIATGHGYSDISDPAAPPSDHFPPGYPFILAMLMKVGVTELTTLTWMNGLFLWAGLMVLFAVFWQWSGDRELAALVVVLCMFNAHLLQYATVLMSEVPFLLAMAVTLFAHVRSIRLAPGDRRWPWLLLLVLASVSMLYIRTAGIAVVGALALHLALRLGWHSALLYGGAVLLLQAPWQIRSQRLGGGSYLRQLTSADPYQPGSGTMQLVDWKQRIGSNAKRYFAREVPSALMPWTSLRGEKPIRWGREWPLGVFVTLLIVAGLWAVGPPWRSLLLGLLVFNGIVLLLWPQVWYGVRFILPLVPILVFLVMLGLLRISQRVALHFHKPRWSAWAVLLPIAVIYLMPLNSKVLAEGSDHTHERIRELAAERAVVVDAGTRRVLAPSVAALEVERRQPYPPRFNEYIRLAEWVRDNTPAGTGTVICCRKRALFHLFSERYVTGFAKDPDPGAVIDDLAELGVSHVVFDHLGFTDTHRFLWPALQRDPFKFTPVHGITDPKEPRRITYLLAFRPELGYHGPWRDGLKHGTGRWVEDDGTVFEGSWVHDTIQGPGVLLRADGIRIEGHWRDGALIAAERYTRDGVMLREE